MKILMATMGMDIGGAETHIAELAAQLTRLGHEVVVVSNGGAYVPELLSQGVRHVDAPLHRRDVGCMLRARSILRKTIRRERPDVVHAHARIPAFLCDGLCRQMHVPFVTTAHWVFDTGGALRYLTRWGQRTIAVSDDIKDYLIREYGVPAQHITVTINGIDTRKFSPEIDPSALLDEFNLRTDAPIIACVSRMDEDRALVSKQLIELAPRLARFRPGTRILIAGGGNVFEASRRRAQHVNRELGYQAVVMTGPRTDINQIVAAGDVFVGVSRAALEAMAAGKPVILAGNEGYQGLFTSDKLEQARQGNFCCRGLPQSNPERLFADLKWLLQQPRSGWERLGLYGRKVVQTYYSVDRMAKDCLQVYEQVRTRKYHVLMSGYYGFHNAGDDAILQSIHHSVERASRDVALTVLSNNPEQTERDYGLPALQRFHFLQVLRALLRCDALISGGGSLLQDRTSTRSLLYYLSIIRCAKLLGKPVMLYANGIGPVQRPANRRRVKRAVERADVVTLRDHSSRQELIDMGVSRGDLRVTADPVFRLAPADPARCRALLRDAGMVPPRPFVAVSVREWPDTEHFFRELARLCDELYEAYGLTALFLLMQPELDREASHRVMEQMKSPSYLLEQSCTPRELMGVLGQSKLCLAMRLHTLIFAARMAVPVLGLVYDPKVASFLEELNLPCAGRVEDFDARCAMEQADALMLRYGTCCAELRERVEQLSEAAQENERQLLALLEGRGKK